MFYRIRDDTTGCEPRKLFNGAPPALMRGCRDARLPWCGWEMGLGRARTLWPG